MESETKEIAETAIEQETEVKEQPMWSWTPRTELGRKVKNGEINDLGHILKNGFSILESEIVNFLIPDLEHELIEIGQSKGKFGGGKRSIWKQQ